MTKTQPLKYSCFDPSIRQTMLERCTDNVIKNYLVDLYELIEYQMLMIHDQRREIVAINHKKVWEHYDKKNIEE
jgi:hypothetical protein